MLLKHPLFASSSFINGEWVQNEDTFAVYNPADGTLIANLSNASVAQAEQAIAAATRHFGISRPVLFVSTPMTFSVDKQSAISQIAYLKIITCYVKSIVVNEQKWSMRWGKI